MLKELCRIDMKLSSYPKVLYELSKLPEPQKKAAFRAYARMDLFFLLRYVCNLQFMTEGVMALNGPTPKSFLQKSTKLKEFSTQDELSALDLTEEIAEILDDPRKAGSRKVEAERRKWEALEEQTRTARWFWSRCWDIQENPNGHLDLWSREHGKSLIITFGKSIQDIIRSHGDDPIDDTECTIGIFSHTRPIAKSFLTQIAREVESNVMLKTLFPDIFWDQPKRDAPCWSMDAGIVVKRKGNPKESTVSASGLIDGMPTGMHYTTLVYDDVVTLASVSSPDMIKKTTEALALSYNLGHQGVNIRRFIGTRYHYNDTYKTILDRKTAIPRIHPASEDGEFSGKPVLWKKELLDQKVRDYGPYVAACQLMQNPRADDAQSFREEWLQYYDLKTVQNLNIYIVVDPANSKKRNSDYTFMGVIGLGADQNYYMVDMIRDRLNLAERCAALFRLHQKYRPLGVGYERYGLQVDIEHIKYEMDRANYRFPITEVAGLQPKDDRIKRLVPLFSNGRFYLRYNTPYGDVRGEERDMTAEFVNDEYMAFPVSTYKDMLDGTSRILDLNTQFPGGWLDVELDYTVFDEAMI